MRVGRKITVIKKIAKQYLDMHEKTQDNASIFKTVLNTKLPSSYRTVWLIIAITAFSLCLYQCYERMAYYWTKPIKVNSEIKEKSVDNFPALHLSSLVTDESFAYYSTHNLNNNKGCGHTFPFKLDNHTSLRKLMKLGNFTKMIKKISYKRGNKVFKNMFQTNEKYTLYSTITRIESVKKVSVGPKARLTVKTQTTEKFDPRNLMVQIFLTPKNYILSFVPVTAYRLGHMYNQNEISFTSRTYSFLNRKTTPCWNISVMQDCHEKCYLNNIKQQNFSCHLPFLPKEIDENCIANELACNYTRILGEIRSNVNPPYTCNCARECEKTVISSHYNYDKYKTNQTIVYSYSNWVLEFKEYYSDDFIALLCDVGGYLSLYTGVSCIAIVKLFFHDIIETVRKRFFPVKKSRFEKSIISKIESIMLKRKQCAKKKNQPDFKQLEQIKIIFILLSVIFSCYLIYIRVVNYFGFPIYVTTVLVQDRYVQPPTIIFCSENSDLYEKKEKFMNDTRSNASHISGGVKCVEDVDILDLLDQFENDAEELWEATGDLDNYAFTAEVGKMFGKTAAIFKMTYGNLSYFDTVFGRCIKVESGSVEYNPVSAVNGMGMKGKGIRCNSHSKLFLMKSEERMDYLTYNIQPHDVIMNIKFSRQTRAKLNTPRNPCTALEKYNKCAEDCVNMQMEKEHITCRLLFLNSTNLPMCGSQTDAKATRKSFIKVHLNSDALRDCNCHPPCYSTLHSSVIDYSTANADYDTQYLVLTTYEFDGNIREIFKDELAVPFLKLLCDIGSLLGFFLGLSILLCLELLDKFLHAITKKSNKVA